jgi:hypothetical protein
MEERVGNVGDVSHKAASEVMTDPEWRNTEKRLVRKLDMTLMPMVWVLYLFNYLDRNNISYDDTLSTH